MPLANITASNLAHFHGSENTYSNPMYREYKYTEGIKFLSDNGAAWLITDILAVVKLHKKVAKEEFVKITLTVNDRKCHVVYDDGNGKVLYKQNYDSCDFPLPTISIYCEYNTLMLPSER